MSTLFSYTSGTKKEDFFLIDCAETIYKNMAFTVGRFLIDKELSQVDKEYLDGLLKYSWRLDECNRDDNIYGINFNTISDRVRWYVFLSFARFIWEDESVIIEWNRIRKFLPIDAAYFVCSMTQHYPIKYHVAIPHIGELKTLKDFNFNEAIIKQCDKVKEFESLIVFKTLTSSKWFSKPYNPVNKIVFNPPMPIDATECSCSGCVYGRKIWDNWQALKPIQIYPPLPLSFSFTLEIYNELNKEEPNYQRVRKLIQC